MASTTEAAAEKQAAVRLSLAEESGGPFPELVSKENPISNIWVQVEQFTVLRVVIGSVINFDAGLMNIS